MKPGWVANIENHVFVKSFDGECEKLNKMLSGNRMG